MRRNAPPGTIHEGRIILGSVYGPSPLAIHQRRAHGDGLAKRFDERRDRAPCGPPKPNDPTTARRAQGGAGVRNPASRSTIMGESGPRPPIPVFCRGGAWMGKIAMRLLSLFKSAAAPPSNPNGKTL